MRVPAANLVGKKVHIKTIPTYKLAKTFWSKPKQLVEDKKEIKLNFDEIE